MVHYTHSCLRAAQRESLCQGCRQRKGGANTLHGRLTLHFRHMPTECADLERAADIDGDDDGNSTAGSIADLAAAATGTSGRALEDGEIENSLVCAADEQPPARSPGASEIQELTGP